MTTINESQTAKGYTPAALVPAAFGRPRTIDGIVIHHWGVTGQLHDDVVKFFVSGPGTTSAHFVVSAGRIDCIVSPLDAAWHSGNAVGNATTIGIECRPEATDADYATVAELVRFLRSKYGSLPLSPHRQWNATACPGVWNLSRVDDLAGGMAAAGSITPQSTATTPAPAVQEDELSAAAEAQIARVLQILEAQEGDNIRQRIVAIDDRTATTGTKYLKGDKDATLYSFEGGKLRGINLVEWQATGHGYRTLPQDIIDALPKA